MAPNYVERVALAGAFFFGLQLWEAFRANRSRDVFFARRALPALSWDAAVTERRKIVGAPAQVLSVDNFANENLEVRTGWGGGRAVGGGVAVRWRAARRWVASAHDCARGATSGVVAGGDGSTRRPQLARSRFAPRNGSSRRL